MVVLGLLTSCTLTYIWKDLLFFEASNYKANNANTEFLDLSGSHFPTLAKKFHFKLLSVSKTELF